MAPDMEVLEEPEMISISTAMAAVRRVRSYLKATNAPLNVTEGLSKVECKPGLSIGHFVENSRRKKLILKNMRAKTQEFFYKNLVFRQFFTMCTYNF